MSEAGASDAHSSPRADPTSLRGSERPDDRERPHRKRPRVRLSCLECRRRKLSCGRGKPCARCLKSGTPERCVYEIQLGRPPSRKESFGLPSSSSEDRLHDRIQHLEDELSKLKDALSRQGGYDGGHTRERLLSPGGQPSRNDSATIEVALPSSLSQFHHDDNIPDKDEFSFFRGEDLQTRFFGPHNACMAFSQLTELAPFMRETAEEWLKPLHIAQNPKDRATRGVERERRYQEPAPELEALLPSKSATDALVSVYLDQFEQLHRIVHVPSFQRDYAGFWDPARPRCAALTALVLSMLSISSCMNSGPLPSKFAGMASCSHKTAETWIVACEEWYQRQSQKHRKLIHHQIALLLYLTKRVNTVKKKRFWTESGVLAREGIVLGLHLDPARLPNAQISPFHQEMRRRLWATIQEFDLQAAFDNGSPMLDGPANFDVDPPRNLHDEDFDEDSTDLPPSRPIAEYTAASYQNLARWTLPLRLEISRLLSRPRGEIEYEEAVRYTDRIMQEIDALPSWDASGQAAAVEGAKKPLLATSLLQIQLLQYLFPLHLPFLRMRKANARYQFSETIYYNAARDIVLLHETLMQHGVQTLNFLRDDALTLAVNLCSVAMLSSLGSRSLMAINSQLTLALLEKCLAMKEDHILRCGNNEPWGYSLMCAAYGLLEVHLGCKDRHTAKAACAERFINLHYRVLAGREPPISRQRQDVSGATSSRHTLPDSASQRRLTTSRSAPYTPTPWWLPNGEPASDVITAQAAACAVPQAGQFHHQVLPVNPNFTMELLGVNLNELWADTFEGLP
ncbi:hypothetical protein VTK73DRAFT_1856 [Phialemonium thermophilum]|uniref:Zn(2)-C6 fungal-type domain-containing protein n=1 Tax=Phialemonium thermophilum TaxID=223376 RepID=A0ABR3VSX1_9PEZI